MVAMSLLVALETTGSLCSLVVQWQCFSFLKGCCCELNWLRFKHTQWVKSVRWLAANATLSFGFHFQFQLQKIITQNILIFQVSFALTCSCSADIWLAESVMWPVCLIPGWLKHHPAWLPPWQRGVSEVNLLSWPPATSPLCLPFPPYRSVRSWSDMLL